MIKLYVYSMEALYDLKNDNSIVIKSADKVSAVLVSDREDYIKRQRNN